METHEKSEIERLAEEKAKKAAKKEATGKHFVTTLPIWLPLWITAMILALTGGSSIHVLFLSLAGIFVLVFAYFVIEDSSYTKHYRMYLEQLQKGEMDAK